ncbi:MAG: DUF4129 domain-containing protein [Sandaracinaceae bacterium]|nr:DUF4129 domain-containing protein [Sandaracinaceae bacterium]
MSARRPTRDLAPVGPVGLVDRAFVLAREGGLEVTGPAWLGGALLAATALAIFYVERVEGITSLRLPAALLLALAWWGRAYLIGRSARRVAATMWDSEPEPEAGRAVDVLRTSLVVGLGMWCWSWMLVVGSLAGPIGVALVLPFFALRGAVAPSWTARAACTAKAGWRGFWAAIQDSAGQRFAGIVTESLLLAGAMGLVLNLFGVVLFAVLLARSLGGFELAALESFVSPSNTFVVLVIASCALVLLEPVRAAHAAAVYVGARVREEGLDLRVSVDTAIAHSNAKRGQGAAPVARAAAMIAVVLLGASRVDAQEPPVFDPPPAPELFDEAPYTPPVDLPSDPGPLPSYAAQPRDVEVQGDVDAILARAEFREFEDDRGAGLRDLIDRFFDWLGRPRDELPDMNGARLPTLPLPGAWAFIVLGGALLIGVGIYLFVTRQQAAKQAQVESALASVSADIRDRPPRSFLEEAALLAEQGMLREALRSLYLATLVALDRRRFIAFDPHLTNWQYLRQMPRGSLRDAFRHFTRLFDHKWYGREDTSREDYERCRELAAQIVEAEVAS